jgi:DNA-binding MarR family transcriptional regulator
MRSEALFLCLLHLLSRYHRDVLFLICDQLNGGRSQKEVSRDLGMDQATLSRIISRFFEKNYTLKKDVLDMIELERSIERTKLERIRNGRIYPLVSAGGEDRGQAGA